MVITFQESHAGKSFGGNIATQTAWRRLAEWQASIAPRNQKSTGGHARVNPDAAFKKWMAIPRKTELMEIILRESDRRQPVITDFWATLDRVRSFLPR